MLSIGRGLRITAGFGLLPEPVEQANALPAASLRQKVESGAASEFGSAFPIVFEAMLDGSGDFVREVTAGLGIVFPAAKVALQDLEVGLPGGKPSRRRFGQPIDLFTGREADGLGKISSEFPGKPPRECRRITGADGVFRACGGNKRIQTEIRVAIRG